MNSTTFRRHPETDRPGIPRVSREVLRALAIGFCLVLALACGGKDKKGATTPGGSGGAAGGGGQGSTGSVAYEETSGGFDIGTETPDLDVPDDGAGGGAAGPDDGASGGAAGRDDAGGEPAIKPPGVDMSDAQRAQVVRRHLAAGGQAIRAGDADLAIREARAALDADETNAEAMIVLAHGYYLKEYDDKALAILDIAKKQEAGARHPVQWMLRGLIHDRHDRQDEALEAYEKATQLKPDYAGAWTNLGVIYLKRKRYGDAVGVFERVVQIQPDSPAAHVHLGAAYRGHSADFAGKDDARRDELLRKSERELKTAMAKNPQYAPAYFNLGLLYLDAEPYPGLEPIPRLKFAMQYLSEYKRVVGPRLPKDSPVDEFLAAAQKQHDREVKREEARKRREERERERQRREAEKQGGGGSP